MAGYSKFAASLGILLATSAPARAADETGDAASSRQEKLIERIDGLTTTIEGLRDKGGDSIAENGGKLEGYILSSIAIEGAARQIAKEVLLVGSGQAGTRKVLVMAASDAAATDGWLVFDANIKGLCYRVAGNADCKPAATTAPGPGAAGGNPFAIAGAVLPLISSLLRADTEISSLGDGLKESRLLAKAMTGACAEVADGQANKACRPVLLFEPVRMRGSIEASEPWKRLSSLVARRNDLDKPKASDAVKAKIKAVDDFVGASLTADDKGKVPLVEAIRAERLTRLIGDRDILTVNIDQADGTVLKRKGLDVALGAPSVRASGGVIVDYMFEEKSAPENEWLIKRAGMIACTTTLTELKRVHHPAQEIKAQCRGT